MGFCTVGSSGEECSPSDCDAIHGDFREEKGTGCLLLSVLGDERAILLTRHFLYPPIIEFRDDVLPRTAIGERMSEHFDRFYPEAVNIARSDPMLVSDIVQSMTYLNAFLRAMLGEQLRPGRFGPTPSTYRAERLRPSTVDSIMGLIARFRASASPEFAEALNEFEAELPRFTNLTPDEALIELRAPARSGVE